MCDGLFQHNWVSRRADLGPKTIEQIHKEAKIEEQEEQRKVHQQLLSKDKRRPGQRGQYVCYRLILFTAWSPFSVRYVLQHLPNALSIVLISVYIAVIQREETWNTVPVPKNSRTIDPNKIPKITKVMKSSVLSDDCA